MTDAEKTKLAGIATGATVDLLTKLGDYEAAIAEGSHVFNFSAVDFDDDSELILEVDGAATLAFNLLMRINGVSSINYFTDGRQIIGGVNTPIDLNDKNEMELMSSIILVADTTFAGKASIKLSKAATSNRPSVDSVFGGNGQQVANSTLTVNQANISTVQVFTSTSTWKIGTRMTLYKKARA